MVFREKGDYFQKIKPIRNGRYGKTGSADQFIDPKRRNFNFFFLHTSRAIIVWGQDGIVEMFSS